MSKPNIVFEISGELTPTENIKGTFPQEKIIRHLNDEAFGITFLSVADIEKLLERTVNEHFPKIELDLYFHEGSVLVTGILVIETREKFAKGISFYEYLSRLLKIILQKNIRSKLRDFKSDTDLDIQSNVKVNIEITSVNAALNTPANDVTSIPPTEVANTHEERVLPFVNLTPSRLIILITMINIIFFVGGTVLNFVQVKSFQEKMDAGNEKFTLANEKYNEASRVFSNTQSEYENNVSQIQRLRNELEAKKNSILSSLSTDTINIKNDVATLNENFRQFKEDNEELNKELDKNRIELDKLTSNIERLNDRKIKFHFKDVWEHSGADLLIALALLIILPIFSLVRKR